MRNLLALGTALLAGLSFGAPGGWAQRAYNRYGDGITINTNGSRLGIGVADVTVVIGVEQIERSRIELDAARRHRQRDPQLGIELGEVDQIIAGLQRRL